MQSTADFSYPIEREEPDRRQAPRPFVHPRDRKQRYMVYETDSQGHQKRYTLDPNDPETWNRFWDKHTGKYVSTKQKERRKKEDRQLRSKPLYTIPAPLPTPADPPVAEVVEGNSLIAWAVLILLLSLFLGVVVQLKDDPRSPVGVVRSLWSRRHEDEAFI